MVRMEEGRIANLHTRTCAVVFAKLGSDAGTEAAAAQGTLKGGIDDPLFAYARLAGTSPLRLPLDERLDRFRGTTDPFEPRVDTRDAEAGSGSEASTVKISNIISSPGHNHESGT